MTIDAKQIMQNIMKNNETLRSCLCHKFIDEKVTIGQKITCVNCGGKMRLTDIGNYLAGYKAAGGDVKNVWWAFK